MLSNKEKYDAIENLKPLQMGREEYNDFMDYALKRPTAGWGVAYGQGVYTVQKTIDFTGSDE